MIIVFLKINFLAIHLQKWNIKKFFYIIPESQVLQIAHFFVKGDDFRQEVDLKLQYGAGFAGASAHWLYGEDTPRYA